MSNTNDGKRWYQQNWFVCVLGWIGAALIASIVAAIRYA